MEFGLSTCILYGQPLQDALPTLAGHGVRTVEYAAFNLVMSSRRAAVRDQYLRTREAWSLRADDIPTSQILDVSNSWGIRVLQLHSPVYTLASPNPKERRRSIEKTEMILELCSKLGAPVLVVHAIWPPPTKEPCRSTLDRSTDSIRILARRASDLGVKVAVENGWRNPCGSRAGDLVRVVDETDADHVCICLDTGHSQRSGTPPPCMARALGHRLGATHVHDFDGDRDHLPPFAGRISWHGFAAALSEAAYLGPIIGEIDGQHVGVQRSVRAMRRLVQLFEAGRNTFGADG